MKYSKEEKARLLEGWKESGKSISAYVKDNGLVRWTFTKWIKESRNGERCFVEVSQHAVLRQGMGQAMRAAAQVPEIVIEKGDMKIHVPLGLGGTALRAVMEGLGVAS